jgi:hypothetical protein
MPFTTSDFSIKQKFYPAGFRKIINCSEIKTLQNSTDFKFSYQNDLKIAYTSGNFTDGILRFTGEKFFLKVGDELYGTSGKYISNNFYQVFGHDTSNYVVVQVKDYKLIGKNISSPVEARISCGMPNEVTFVIIQVLNSPVIWTDDGSNPDINTGRGMIIFPNTEFLYEYDLDNIKFHGYENTELNFVFYK